MGHKNNCVWILELFANNDKTKLLNVYELQTMRDVGCVLGMRPTTVSNFYHNLTNARGNLNYVTIYQKNNAISKDAADNQRTRRTREPLSCEVLDKTSHH